MEFENCRFSRIEVQEHPEDLGRLYVTAEITFDADTDAGEWLTRQVSTSGDQLDVDFIK